LIITGSYEVIAIGAAAFTDVGVSGLVRLSDSLFDKAKVKQYFIKDKKVFNYFLKTFFNSSGQIHLKVWSRINLSDKNLLALLKD